MGRVVYFVVCVLSLAPSWVVIKYYNDDFGPSRCREWGERHGLTYVAFSMGGGRSSGPSRCRFKEGRKEVPMSDVVEGTDALVNAARFPLMIAGPVLGIVVLIIYFTRKERRKNKGPDPFEKFQRMRL